MQAWNGSFTFTGTDALNLGTGNVTMNGPADRHDDRQYADRGRQHYDTANGSNAYLDITKAGAGTLALGENVTFGTGVTTFSNISAGALNLAGNITLDNGGSSGSSTINNASAGLLVLSGAIDSGGTSNNLILNSTTTGAIEISNNGNFYGSTTLDGGILEVGASGALADAPLTVNGGEVASVGNAALSLVNSDITISSSAAVKFGDSVNTGGITTGNITFGDGSTSTFNVSTTLGTPMLATGTTGVTIAVAGGKTVSLATMTGSNGVTYEGTGTVSYTSSTAGSYTYTGGTTLTDGVTLSILAKNTNAITGTITITGTAHAQPKQRRQHCDAEQCHCGQR